ncbi:MAG: glycoside hydrolase family 2 TIM barrel-domain containing protein [Woeseiaceae bacterium]
MRKSIVARALLYAGLMLIAGNAMGEAISVELKQNEQGWQLYRGGEPYFIRGAGGSHSLQQLADAGGNSVRTWGGDDIGPLLDEAHRLGLTVAVGIWLEHERHGFDYKDDAQVAEQLQKARDMVLKFKDHPAVLLWGIGNEMEGFEAGDDPAIWAAVNDVAAMAKELDPHHPTMTVTAEIGGGRIDSVHKNSPAIDIHGINAYGGAASIAERLRAGGASKPFVLTEFGPRGSWEAPTTSWGAPFEQTSTEKAAFYRNTYEQSISAEPGFALGSYAFTWGFKMEATATWFGMFLNDGSRLGVIDTMSELWSGSPPRDLAPTIENLVLQGPNELDPSEELKVTVNIADPEDGPIRTHWVLRPESGDYATGGDFRPQLPDIEGVVIHSGLDAATVRMPEYPGEYRLFLYAYDAAGNAATANLPLLVKGEVRTRLPLSVYEDSLEHMPWVPSGWMGNTEALTLDGANTDNPQAGSASIRMRYTGTFGWVGVAWQNPPNNWGEQDGGFDLTGANELEVWARGEYGGEKIKIGVGLLESDRAFPDSGITSVDGIVLTNDWQRYTVPLKNTDLSSLKTGFVVVTTGRTSPVTIYLDSIRFIR